MAPAAVRGPGFLLAQLGRMAQQQWTDFLAESGATQAAFAMLVVLGEAGRLRQRELAGRVAVDPRNAVSTVAHLVERGMIATERDPRDGRGKVLALTAAGAARLEALTGGVAERGAAFFAALSEDDRMTLERLLRVLYEAHVGGR